jgi:hypothetical protein
VTGQAVTLTNMDTVPPDFQAIYFDTNPLLAAEWPGVSVILGNLLYGARTWWNIPTFIPETVLMEAEENWVRDLQDEISRFRNAAQQVERKAGSIPCYTRIDHSPVEKLRALYWTMRDQTVGRYEIGIAPFGTKTAAEFFRLATRYVLPFKEGGQGAGFQDAVILQSVLEHLHPEENRKAIFIAQDAALKKTSLEAFFPGFNANKLEFMELKVVWERPFHSYFDATVTKPWREEGKNALEAVSANISVWCDFLSNALKEPMLRDDSSFGTRVTALKLLSVDSVTIRDVDMPIPELDENPDRNVTISVEATAECTALLKTEHYDFLAVFSNVPRIEGPPGPPEIVEGKVHWSGKIRGSADIVDRQFRNLVPEAIEREKESG